MRTLEEIRERLESQRKDAGEALMWQTCSYHPLCVYLPEFYQEGLEDSVEELTREHVIQEMNDYMPFAVDKAKDQRGISASRSIWKYEQWLWVLEDPLSQEIGAYSDYGLTNLEKIAEKYDLKLEKEE